MPTQLTTETATITTARDNGLSLIQKQADTAKTADDLANLVEGIAAMNSYLLSLLCSATRRVIYQDPESMALGAVEEQLARDAFSAERTDLGLLALLAAHELLSGTSRSLFVTAEQAKNAVAEGGTHPQRVTS